MSNSNLRVYIRSHIRLYRDNLITLIFGLQGEDWVGTERFPGFHYGVEEEVPKRRTRRHEIGKGIEKRIRVWYERHYLYN
jgi:hypothetical protein